MINTLTVFNWLYKKNKSINDITIIVFIIIAVVLYDDEDKKRI